jgi:hypothetical protein
MSRFSCRRFGRLRRAYGVGVPRGGIKNRVGGVKIVAKGEVGRATATLGVTRTTHATEPHRGEITCTAASANTLSI